MSTSNVISNYNKAWSNTNGVITALEKFSPPSLENTVPYILVGTESGKLFRFWDGDSNSIDAQEIILDPSFNTPITAISVSPDGVVVFVNTPGHCYRYSGLDIIESNVISPVQDIYTNSDNTGGVIADSEEFVYMVAENGNAIYYFDDYGSTGTYNLLYRYPVSNVLQLKDLQFNPTEGKLYVADRFSGNIYSYDFENETGVLQNQINVAPGSFVNAISFDDIGNLFYNYPSSNIVNVFLTSNNVSVKVAGGSQASSTDPLLQQLNNPRAVLTISSGLYVSSDVSVGSELYRITFNFVPRNASIVPAPQFKRINCGIAAPGNCKRAIVPFNPREYWGWGSPNRPFLTPDPNVSCVPSVVFQLCPTIPPVVQPIPPIPPIPIPILPTIRTEIATSQFNTRRTGRSSQLGDLTNYSSVSISGLFRTAPALGRLSEIYAVNTVGDIYKFNTSGGTLFDPPSMIYSLGKQVTAASPCVANTGALVVATNDGGLYRFNSAGNLLWQKNTGAQVFGSPGCFTNSNATIDNVFFASGKNIYNFQASTGNLVWSKTLAGSETFRSSIYVGPLIVVGTGLLGSVYAYNRTTGTLVWKYPNGTTNLGVPVVSTPHLIGSNYIFGAGSNLYALTSNGLLAWNYTVSGSIESSPALVQDSTNRIWSYFTTTCNVLYGVRKNTNTTFTTWKSVETIDEECSPILDISSGGPYVYGYNSNTGEVYKYVAQYTSSPTQSAIATFTASGQIDCKSLVSTRQSRMYVFTLSDVAYRIR